MFGCLFGHKKKYVAIKEDVRNGYLWRCNWTIHCRWVCESCDKMGSDHKDTGTWKIEFGKLLPDHKAWANFRE